MLRPGVPVAKSCSAAVVSPRPSTASASTERTRTEASCSSENRALRRARAIASVGPSSRQRAMSSSSRAPADWEAQTGVASGRAAGTDDIAPLLGGEKHLLSPQPDCFGKPTMGEAATREGDGLPLGMLGIETTALVGEHAVRETALDHYWWVTRNCVRRFLS